MGDALGDRGEGDGGDGYQEDPALGHHRNNRIAGIPRSITDISMSWLTLVILLVGLVLLVAGAEVLVKGASNLAQRVGLSPLVIGLTIVAYGTSAPELAVSLQSSFAGAADIALGNVVGSNIFNVLFILGISALITPLVVAQQLIRLDVPILIGVSLLTWIFASTGQRIVPWEGLILFAGAVAYTVFLVVQGKQESDPAVQAEYEQEFGDPSDPNLPPKPFWQTLLIDLALIAGGLVLLVGGSRFLIDSAVTIARAIGVSELIIGLTIVAAGTSLPELATSAIASFRGERDIAVGNVIGSNIFNLLCVLGLSSAISPQGIAVSQVALHFDIPVMVAIAMVCLPIFFTGNLICRLEGSLFLGYYLLYSVYLIFASVNHDNLPLLSRLFFIVVLPLSLLFLGAMSWQEAKQQLNPQEESQGE